MLTDILESSRHLLPADAHAEVRVQKNRSCRVTLLGGNLTGNAKAETSGVSARVYKNGVYGFSSMAECTEEAVAAVLSAAADNASFMDRRAGRGKGLLPAIPEGYRALEADISDPEQKLYADFAKEIDAYILKKYPNLASRAVIATADSMEKRLLVSDGVSGHTILPRSYIYVMMNSETTSNTPMIPPPMASTTLRTWDRVEATPAS